MAGEIVNLDVYTNQLWIALPPIASVHFLCCVSNTSGALAFRSERGQAESWQFSTAENDIGSHGFDRASCQSWDGSTEVLPSVPQSLPGWIHDSVDFEVRTFCKSFAQNGVRPR